MFIALLIASTIYIFGTFAFFGNAIDYVISPNMFDLMFGLSAWKQYGGMTFLFIWQMAIILLAIRGYSLAYQIKTNGDNDTVSFTVFAVIFSLVAAVVSFCTLPLVGLDGTAAKLGVGPIFYSILHIISMLILIAGQIYETTKSNNTQYNAYNSSNSDVEYSKKTPAELWASSSIREASRKPLSSLDKTNSNNTINVLTENEKAELIIKYKKMLDEGILTQEEFDAKKKQLLK